MTTTVPLGPVNAGVAVHDSATGTGYILHSQQSVFTRFAASPPPNTLLGLNSQHMVAVRYTGLTWQYSNDATWIDFTPDPTDRLIASVDFDTNSIDSLIYAFGSVDGIEQGFVRGDLTFIPNRFNGLNDDAEFTIQGTEFEISAEPNFPTAFRPFPITTAAGGSVDYDQASGNLTYTPPADFYGDDSFIYFIADEGEDIVLDANGDPVRDVNGDIVTEVNKKYGQGQVDLTVAPVNDQPSVTDKIRYMDENDTITVSGTELALGILGDGDPQLDVYPYNETNQVGFVTSLSVNDGNTVTNVTAGNAVENSTRCMARSSPYCLTRPPDTCSASFIAQDQTSIHKTLLVVRQRFLTRSSSP